MKSWLEPKSERDIQVFIRFTNFYRHFIQGISKIVALLTLMLKISTGNTVNAVSNRKKNCSGNKISKTIKSKSASSRTDFLTPKARLAFTQLRQAFTKAPIFQYFDLKYYI